MVMVRRRSMVKGEITGEKRMGKVDIGSLGRSLILVLRNN